MKIKEKLFAFIKSLLIGICVFIPGYNARDVALKLKINDTIRPEKKEIFKNFWPPFLTFVLIFVAIFIPIVIFWCPLHLTLSNALFVMTGLFAGFMAGNIPSVTKEVNKESIHKYHYLILLLSMVIFIVIGVTLTIKKITFYDLFSPLSYKTFLMMIPIGLIISIGFVLPVISAPFILLSLGFYKPLINLFDVFKYDYQNVPGYIGVFFTLLTVVIISYFLFKPLSKFLLSKYKTMIYFILIGIAAGSLFIAFYNAEMLETYKRIISKVDNYWNIYIGLLLLFVGAITTFIANNKLREYFNATR